MSKVTCSRLFTSPEVVACSGAINFVLIGYHFVCHVPKVTTNTEWSTHANEHTGGLSSTLPQTTHNSVECSVHTRNDILPTGL